MSDLGNVDRAVPAEIRPHLGTDRDVLPTLDRAGTSAVEVGDASDGDRSVDGSIETAERDPSRTACETGTARREGER